MACVLKFFSLHKMKLEKEVLMVLVIERRYPPEIENALRTQDEKIKELVTYVEFCLNYIKNLESYITAEGGLRDQLGHVMQLLPGSPHFRDAVQKIIEERRT